MDESFAPQIPGTDIAATDAEETTPSENKSLEGRNAVIELGRQLTTHEAQHNELIALNGKLKESEEQARADSKRVIRIKDQLQAEVDEANKTILFLQRLLNVPHGPPSS